MNIQTPDAETVIMWVCGFALVFILSMLGWEVYSETKATKIELINTEWQCTKEDIRTIILPQSSGKSTILIPHITTECSTYERIKENIKSTAPQT